MTPVVTRCASDFALGGRALVGVPSGKDGVAFNSNRIYGRVMLPHLFANWKQIYSTYKDFPADGFEAKNISEFCAFPDDDLIFCYQPMTVLEK